MSIKKLLKKKLFSLNNLLCILLVIVLMLLSSLLYTLHKNKIERNYYSIELTEEDILIAKNMYETHCYNCHKDLNKFVLNKNQEDINKTLSHSEKMNLDMGLFNERIIFSIIEYITQNKN